MTFKRITRIVGSIALAALLLLPTSCKKETLSLTLDWRPEPEFGGFYQAKLVTGGFKQRGVEIEIKSAGAGAPTWKLVDEGKTDFATTSADQLMIGRSQGADVVAIFAVYQTSPQGIMVHSKRGFKNIKDVFMSPGTLSAENNAWLKFLLNKFGKPGVQIVGNPTGISTYLTKDNYSQQCFVTSEPIEAAQKGSDPASFLIASEGFNPYVTVLITSGKTLREKPELVSKVVAACRDGWRAYLDDPTAANKEMGALNHDMDARTFNEAAAAQKPLIETDETRKNGLGTMTLERWQTLRQQLIDLKEIDKDKAPKAEDCFVNPK